MKAPAKINLFLKILSRRSDGYHELYSRFARVDWLFDEVFLLPARFAAKLDGLGICEATWRIKDAGFASASDDLGAVWSDFAASGAPVTVAAASAAPSAAANSLQPGAKMVFKDGVLGNFLTDAPIFARILPFVADAEFCVHTAVAIFKRIPVCSGLGGASSDAAAILRLLERAGALSAPAEQIAPQIGADVAFFLSGCECANVGGIGEIIAPVAERAPRVSLAFGAECSTPAIYGEFARAPRYSSAEQARELAAANCEQIAARPALELNDLLPAVLRNYPHLRNFIDDGYFLSGSGGAFFKFCNNL